jgi:hypothetical protein
VTHTPADFYQLATPINGFPDQKSFDIMKSHRVRYVVVRLGEYGPQRKVLLDRFPPYERNLRLLTTTRTCGLYEIVSLPSGPDAQ